MLSGARRRAGLFPRAVVVLASLAIATSCSDPTVGAETVYSATMTGAREVPPNASTATGSAVVRIQGSTLTYTIATSTFSTPITAAHIYIGDAGVIGAIIVAFDIKGQSGTIASGTVDLSRAVTFNTLTLSGDSLRVLVDAGLTYVNVHTAAYPGGEIRGQILR